MSRLVCLPSEIFPMILGNLSQQDLIPLLTTCKSLYPQVESSFYRRVNFIIRKWTKPGQGYRGLLQFLEVVIRKPKLATLVKELVIHTGQVTANPDGISTSDISIERFRAELAHVQEALHLIHNCSFMPKSNYRKYSERENDFMGSFLFRNPDALVTLLLSRLTTLESFETLPLRHIYSDTIFQDTWLQHAQCACVKGLLLPRLKSIVVGIEPGTKHIDSDFLTGFWPFNIHTLERLEIIMDEKLLYNLDGLPKNVFVLHSLKSLSLLHTKATANLLPKLFLHTPNLQNFEYDWVESITRAYDHYEQPELDPQSWQGIVAALRPLAATLRHLTISIDICTYEEGHDDYHYFCDVEQARGCLEGLRDFDCLESLEVPLFVLLGWSPDSHLATLKNLLPLNLKELCIRDDLVDYGYKIDYAWTPWHEEPSEAREEIFDDRCLPGKMPLYKNERTDRCELDDCFQRKCNVDPIAQQLAGYLKPSGPSYYAETKPHSLRILRTKHLQGREWPINGYIKIRSICEETGVEFITHTRLTNQGDEVRVTTMKPSSCHSGQNNAMLQRASASNFKHSEVQHELISEKRRTVYRGHFWYRDEAGLKAELAYLLKTGYFSNVSADGGD